MPASDRIIGNIFGWLRPHYQIRGIKAVGLNSPTACLCTAPIKKKQDKNNEGKIFEETNEGQTEVDLSVSTTSFDNVNAQQSSPFKNTSKRSHHPLTNNINMRRCGGVMRSLLHKTYVNMKDQDLLNDSQKLRDTDQSDQSPTTALENSELVDLERTFYPPKNQTVDAGGNSFIFRTRSASHVERTDCENLGLTAKELFFHRMGLKYAKPDARRVEMLAHKYPNPDRLYTEVVTPLAEARGQSLPAPVLTSHLRGVYWKAVLDTPWDQSVTATHSHRDQAVYSVYLVACHQLERLGLIHRNGDGQWQPLTCDKVVTMLDTLVKYVESSFIPSRGRGFKIVLSQSTGNNEHSEGLTNQGVEASDMLQTVRQNEEQYKNRSNNLASLGVEASDMPQRARQNGEQCKERSNNLASDMGQRREQTSCLLQTINKSYVDESLKISTGCHKHASSDLQQTAELSEVCGQTLVTSDQYHASEQTGCLDRRKNVDSSEMITDCHHDKPKALWDCAVHVGWPFPFSVNASGISLPSAQLLGYMKAVTKLKTYGLLTACNSCVSSTKLGRLMRLDVQELWGQAMLPSNHQEVLHKFPADAELYCDASLTGFGAYLVLDGVGKVSWLSESWEDHSPSFSTLVQPQKWSFESTLAELFATVTSVCSWKKKLRAKKLVCFSDNQTTVALINSHLGRQIRPDCCVTPFDCLVSSLQAACSNYSIQLYAAWLSRDCNSLADLLSRRDIRGFQASLPQAAGNKTKAKKLSIPWHKYASSSKQVS